MRSRLAYRIGTAQEFSDYLFRKIEVRDQAILDLPAEQPISGCQEIGQPPNRGSLFVVAGHGEADPAGDGGDGGILVSHERL